MSVYYIGIILSIWSVAMETMTFCVPCLFGLEGLVGDELRRLGLENVRVEDRRVFFTGGFVISLTRGLIVFGRVGIPSKAFESSLPVNSLRNSKNLLI